MEPRYQCVALGPTWTWRLLGSNHRELARACNTFTSRQLATDDAAEVAQLARTASIDVILEIDTSWRWLLTAGGVARASSSVPYARRLECLRAVARFRDCAPVAGMASASLIRGGTTGRPLRTTTGRAPAAGQSTTTGKSTTTERSATTGQSPDDARPDRRPDRRPDPPDPRPR